MPASEQSTFMKMHTTVASYPYLMWAFIALMVVAIILLVFWLSESVSKSKLQSRHENTMGHNHGRALQNTAGDAGHGGPLHSTRGPGDSRPYGASTGAGAEFYSYERMSPPYEGMSPPYEGMSPPYEGMRVHQRLADDVKENMYSEDPQNLGAQCGAASAGALEEARAGQQLQSVPTMLPPATAHG
jgi:hypothetical protein